MMSKIDALISLSMGVPGKRGSRITSKRGVAGSKKKRKINIPICSHYSRYYSYCSAEGGRRKKEK